MLRMFMLILVIIFSLVHAGCVPNRMVEGIGYFKDQDYRRAFIRLKPEAVKGHPDAQYAVGYMYYYGKGVVENKKLAWFWINMAAKVGQPDAVAAVRILEEGTLWKQDVFQSQVLQHFPVVKEMY